MPSLPAAVWVRATLPLRLSMPTIERVLELRRCRSWRAGHWRHRWCRSCPAMALPLNDRARVFWRDWKIRMPAYGPAWSVRSG